MKKYGLGLVMAFIVGVIVNGCVGAMVSTIRFDCRLGVGRGGSFSVCQDRHKDRRFAAGMPCMPW